MKDLESVRSYKYLQNELNYINQENSPSHGFDNVSIIIVNNKIYKNGKKHNVFMQAQQPRTASRLSRSSKSKKHNSITRHSSMPNLNKCTKPVNPPFNRNAREEKSKQQQLNKYKQSPYQSEYIVNVSSDRQRFDKNKNPFDYPRQTKFKVYRCQIGASADDGCCCSCNSDAMFEVMKGLYDCYKAKNCDNCDCILCGNLPKDKKKSVMALSEKERLKRAKEEGLLTPLTGKTADEREKILRGLSMKGLPLPEGQTPSEKQLIEKVRTDLGLPKEPKDKAERDRHEQASKAGKLWPLEGHTTPEKEKILKSLHKMDITLPEGRTPSEKSLIARIQSKSRRTLLTPSEQMRRAKAEGLLTSLKGKTPEEKEKILRGLAMKGIPLPEGDTPSDKNLINKVRTDLGVAKEPKSKAERDKQKRAARAGKLLPLEGKTPAQKEKILRDLHNMGISLPEGRTPSEKALIARITASSRHPSKVSGAVMAPSEQMRRAKAEGLLTPLTGKTPEQKEKILKGLAMKGLPLPEGKTPSEKELINKVRADLGLPKEPKNRAERAKHEQAAQAGLLQPLEGKTPAQKEKILKGLHDLGIPLPEGRTPSEKSLIARIAASSRHPSRVSAVSMTPSEQMRQAKAEGLLTPLTGKTPEQKEKILKGLAMKGIPLPEGQTPSEKELINKVRADLGLPKEPKNKAERAKHEQAARAGLLKPLEGKTPAQKEKILRGLHDLGIPLPEGRTPSEKSLIAKIAASKRRPTKATALRLTPSEQLRQAKVKGLLTPLTGKTPEEKQKILEGLARIGLPLPEGKTPSEKELINKVRADLGLPKEPKNKAERDKYNKAAKAGLLQPLDGKTPEQKEKILRGLHDLGISLPEGRTPSEKSLIAKIAASSRHPSKVSGVTMAPSEQMRRAKKEGLLTPLTGKTPEQKEKILKGLAMKGIPLPEGKTPSEKELINKVRAELGLPKEPKNRAERAKHDQAAQAGLLQPLEGKTPAQKEKILRGLHDLGIPLPEGRTASEKSLIAKVAASSRHPSRVSGAIMAPSEQMRRAKAEGLLTPLTGKTPEQKEKILKGLAMRGIPLPEGKTPSEKELINKVRADLGLPKEPKNRAERAKHEQAAQAGLLQPLEGKSPAQKEKILRGLHDLGIPLPEGRTASEKSLIAKVAASSRHPSRVSGAFMAPSEQMRRAKAEGLLTPLTGKTPEQKEKILKGLAMKGIPLPEGKTPSEKELINKVRADLGLPKEPKNRAERAKHEQAAQAGLLQPLEGKTPAQKEKILQGLHDLGVPLPEGRTASEKSLIAKIAAKSRHPSRVSGAIMAPSEQMRRAIAEGLLTPLTGKTPEQKEKILKGLAMRGIPLPEGQTPSEKQLIDKVRADLGLPKEPKNRAERAKLNQAARAGLLQPLEGKTPAQKEKILRDLHDLGIPLPEGRTPSEKSLIAKIAAKSRHPSRVSAVTMAPSAQLRRAKAEGLLTPLTGKTPEQKAKILKGLAMRGIPLPEGTTPSEKELINKVRADLGLPKEPKNKAERAKHDQAARAGLLQPLEGKTPAQKEKILQGLHDLGIPLPEGRTASEKSLIAKIAAKSRHPSRVSAVTMAPSAQLRRAKAEGLLTPLKGKTPEQKEKILKGLAMRGIPLPEGQTPSEKQLIDKVRADLGLPKEPKNRAERAKHDQAARAGLLQPLEGKTPAQKEKILQGLHDLGIPLPEGRTASEKSLIAKIAAKSRHPSRVSAVTMAPSAQLRRAKAEGLLTPLKGKTPEQKEKILKGLAMRGIPLPEGQTPSEKQLIDKVRADLGLPKEPKNRAERAKHEQAAQAGLLQPLEGKTPAQKEKILQGLHDLGIPLPEGRTASEKSLIAKIAAKSRHPSRVSAVPMAPSDQLRRAKAEGLLTPLKGKTPEQKEKILKGLAMRGLPLPEGQTPSEKQLIDKVRADLGLPKEPKNKAEREKHDRAARAGLLLPLEGKTPAQKEKILRGQHNMGIPLPEGRTPSEKSLIARIAASSRHPSKVLSVAASPSEQMRRAKAEGLLTPLTGKTPEQKEKILKGLAMRGIPLPEGKTPSEKEIINKVRADLGLPKEPKNKAERAKHEQAAKAGLLQPLEGKTPSQKEKILKGLHNLGIPLPEGRTPSEKSLIARIAASSRHPSKVSTLRLSPSEQMLRAKAEGLLTPLTGKTPEQKQKILEGLAMKGLPLPEGKTPSEKQLINKVRADLGLPKEPKNKAERDKHEKAARAGLLQPLEGKTPAQKEKILRGLHDLGIPLPEGRTPSEKSLIAKVAASSRHPSRVSKVALAPSEQMRRAKAEGLLTPLTGKTPEQKEKILKGLAMKGIPLPEGKTPSEKELINKVRAELGLPKEPKNKAERAKHEQAAQAGLLQPLEGKTPAQKEKILRGLHDLGIPLPEGRTPSEKSLIAKVAASSRHPSRVSGVIIAPSEQMRRAKTEGLLTPLSGKTPEQKEKILKGLAMKGIPLPEGKTPSEKKLINKVRAELGLPKEPKNRAERAKHEQAAQAGLLQPLEGKTPAEKEKILRGLHDLGIPLPEGRTASEKSLIAKIAASTRHPSKVSTIPLALSEQLRRAKAEGLLTPLTGKTPEQKEKILKGLAMKGIPLPEGKTPSEKDLIDKVRADLGLPKEPKNKAERDKQDKAAKAGLLQPLEGKTPAQKEKILKDLHDFGIPLPEGRTPSEKSLIAKIAASSRHPSRVRRAISKAATEAFSPSDVLRKAKAEGLLTPLTGKSPEQKEKILKGLAMAGLPLPEGQTPSEKKLIDKVRADLGLPKEPKNKAERAKHEQAAKAGLLKPLEGKTPAEKEKILRGLHDLGIALPEGRTASEKSLIAKIAAVRRPVSAIGVATAELEEVMKTTKCDRACGCDKKKIRFKHSYVKIRVTSPDISSFCDCPGECIPGVKSGAFIDNEGIKVTVGRVIGTPSLAILQTNLSYAQNGHKSHSDLQNSCNGSSSVDSCSSRSCSTESENLYLQSSTFIDRINKYNRIVECLGRLQSLDDMYRGVTSETKSVASSFDSVLVVKSEISLCSSSTGKSMDTISSMSTMESSISTNCTHYSDNQSTEDLLSSLLDESIPSDDSISHPKTVGERGTLRNIETVIPQREYTISRVCPTKFNFNNNNMRTHKSNSKTEEPVILLNRLPTKLDVSKIMFKISANKRFACASSIFILVPESDDEEEHSSANQDSLTSINASETSVLQKDPSHVNTNSALRKSSFTKRHEQVCGKGEKFNFQEISCSNDTETMLQNESLNVLRCVDMTNDENYQIHKPNDMTQMLEEAVHGIGTETTTDRPCSCHSKECSTPFVIQNCSYKDHYTMNVMCKQKMRRILPDKALSCYRLPDMRTPFPVPQPCDSTSVVKSRLINTSKVSGCGRLPGMRTPTPELLDLPCNVPTRPSIASSQLPHRTFSCCRFPKISSLSTLSSLMPDRSASRGVERSSLILSHPRPTDIQSKTRSNLTVLLTTSTESSYRLCDITKRPVLVPCIDHSPGAHDQAPDPHEQAPARRQHSMNSPEPASLPTHHLCSQTGRNARYGLKPDMSKKEITIPQRSLRYSAFNEIKPSANTNKGSTRESISVKTSLSRPTDGLHDVSDPITHDNLCLKLHPSPRVPCSHNSCQQSIKLNLSSDEKHYVCEEGIHTITDKICNRNSRRQARFKSRKPKSSTNGKHSVCGDIEGIDIITDANDDDGWQPCFQGSQQCKMIQDVCEDIEDADIIFRKLIQNKIDKIKIKGEEVKRKFFGFIKLLTKKQNAKEKPIKFKSQHDVETTPSFERNGCEKFPSYLSELTERTSDFKASIKKKKPQRTEIELDFDSAVKYYVKRNLEQFRDLIQPLELDQDKYQDRKDRTKLKKSNKKDKRKEEPSECKFANTIKLTPEALPELCPKEMKLCLGRRGLMQVIKPVAGMVGRDAETGMVGCNGFAQTKGYDFIAQTKGYDFIAQTTDHDIVAQTTGHDFAAQTTGHDFVAQTTGHDFIAQTTSHDFIAQTTDHDVVAQTTGHDFAAQTTGHDFVAQTTGHDFVAQTTGHDFVVQTKGHDFIAQTTSHDFIAQTIGHDFVAQTTGQDFVAQTTGQDFVAQTTGDDFVAQTTGHDFVTQTTGQDFVVQTTGHDFVTQTTGNDFVVQTTGHNFVTQTIDLDGVVESSGHDGVAESSDHDGVCQITGRDRFVQTAGRTRPTAW